jgi:hypothetical protein
MLMETKAIESPRRKLSKRLKRALTLLATERVATQQDAAHKCGLSPEHLSRSLKRLDVQAHLQMMIESRLKAGAVRASQRLLELLDASSEHVSLDATKLALGIGGYQVAEGPRVVVNNNIISGYVIDLTPDSPPSGSGPIVDVTPTSEG